MYIPSVCFQDGLMLYVFKSLKGKAKILFENPDWKCWKFGLPCGMFRENCFAKKGLRFAGEKTMCPNTTFKKSAYTFFLNHESVHNFFYGFTGQNYLFLWISENTLKKISKQFVCSSTLNMRMSRNMCKLCYKVCIG